MEWWRLSQIYIFLWATCLTLYGLCTEHLVYTFSNKVGNGNFSYFKLHREGFIRLLLTSTSGDADLYVSSTTLYPDYRNYELKSATCGEDSVEIPVEMTRPVGIGIFGHPSSEVSEFNLFVFADDESIPDSQRPTQLGSNSDEPEESILWSIFVGILKIILDILV